MSQKGRRSMPIKYARILRDGPVVSERELIYFYFDIPDSDKDSLKYVVNFCWFHVPKGEGEVYMRRHFPDVEIKR